MERKKITFDSFIRGSIGCVLVVGILMLVERLSGLRARGEDEQKV